MKALTRADQFKVCRLLSPFFSRTPATRLNGYRSIKRILLTPPERALLQSVYQPEQSPHCLYGTYLGRGLERGPTKRDG